MAAVAVLDATTTLLRVKLGEVSTTASTVLLNYLLKTASTTSYPYPKLTPLSLLSATYTTIAVPASSGDTWVVPSITISNNDNVSHTYTVEYYDGTNLVLLSSPITLQAGKSTTVAVGGSGGGSGGGNINGPASSTNRAVATWSGTAGDTLLNNSNNTIDASGVTSDPAAEITGTAGAGYIGMGAQSSDPSTPGATGFRAFATSVGHLAWRLKNGSDTYVRAFIGTLTAARNYTLQDKSGTVAHLDDIPIGVPGGRLTLTTGTPVTTSNVTAAGTLYYTPYKSGSITIYNGTKWTEYVFTELSLSLTLTSGKNYDVFIYDNAGTLTLELSAAWTNDTTRADALTTQDGVFVKSGVTTRLWLGTIRASGTNTTEDSNSKRFVQNFYNQVAYRDLRTDTTDSWTAGSTWSAVNGGAATWKHERVIGFDNMPMNARSMIVGAVNYVHTIALDGTTPDRAKATQAYQGASALLGITCEFSAFAGIGYHYLQAVEGASVTVYGDNGAFNGIQSGWTVEGMR